MTKRLKKGETLYDLTVRCVRDISYAKRPVNSYVAYERGTTYRANVSCEQFITIYRVFRGVHFPLCEQFSVRQFKKYFVLLDKSN